MRLLFIGYWGVQDALTTTTIIPHLKILASFKWVEQIVFCSIERSGLIDEISISKVKHIPLYSKKRRSVLLTKFSDYLRLFASLKQICLEYSIDLIFCRSALAGAFGHRLNKSLKVPYLVESFEPHARYMVESGVWKSYDLRTIIQRYQERQQKRSASFLLPVSSHYAAKLQMEGIVSEKILLLPCCVDAEEFRFDETKRAVVRTHLGFPPESVVGIYVGKFGGIYYREEAFELYREAFDFFGDDFRLIILSRNSHAEIDALLLRHSIPANKVHVRSVSHDKVPEYLSASDFAFCTIKPSPSRMFCSPVKNGEYWANGLPILIERGIGDDSAIIEAEGGGVILERGEHSNSFQKLFKLLLTGRKNLAHAIAAVANRHRPLHRIAQVYEKVLLGIET